MEARIFKACQFSFGTKIRRFPFIFILLLCALTTLAGCQAKPLHNSIFMADGTIKSMAENTVSKNSSTGDPPCGLLAISPLSIMKDSRAIILLSFEGFVLDGAEHQLRYSLARGKVIESLYGDLQVGDPVIFSVNGTSNSVSGGTPLSYYQQDGRYICFLLYDWGKNHPDIAEQESVDQIFILFNDLVFDLNFENKREIISFRMPNAAAWGNPNPENPKHVFGLQRMEEILGPFQSIMESYAEQYPVINADKTIRALKQRKVAHMADLETIVFSYEGFKAFLEENVLNLDK